MNDLLVHLPNDYNDRSEIGSCSNGESESTALTSSLRIFSNHLSLYSAGTLDGEPDLNFATFLSPGVKRRRKSTG